MRYIFASDLLPISSSGGHPLGNRRKVGTVDDKFLYLNLEAPLADQISFEGKDVLEVGSGSGGFTLKYLAGARYILAVDPDNEAMAELEAQWQAQTMHRAKIKFVCESITDVSLAENSFDIGIFSRSL